MSASRCVLLVAALAVLCTAVSAGYQKSLVIDWGNEWTKVVIMNPHAKSALSRIEMAINEQSNRKTPSVVGITGDADDVERVLGEDAAGLLYRAPSDAYAYLKRLVGHFADAESVKSYLADFPANTYSVVEAPGRKTVRFGRAGGSSVGVEELVVSLLQWCKRLAETHILNNNGETTTVTDAVLIVPEFWTAPQRALYKQLATLAGLNVKASVNELTAVAVDFGNRNLESLAVGGSRKVLFYNVGAHGTSATLFQYTKTEAGFALKALATAFDAEIGGLDFDLSVREHLIADFDQKNKKSGLPSIRNNKKAMAKLLREARDLKEQLSAGTLGSIQVEEIYEGLDYATTLTRDKFEELTRSLLTRAVAPINELYKREAAAMSDVSLLELYGGGVRVPAVQALLSAEHPALGVLGKHIDGDEAAVFGAGLIASNLNGVPGTKKVELEDSFVNSGGSIAEEMSGAEIEALRETLNRFDEISKRRALNQEARNKLESYVVELKDKIETLSSKLSESESEALSSLVSKARDFLDYEAGKATSAAEYTTKLTDLRTAVTPLLKAATDKYNKEQEKVRAREAAEEKKRERENSAKARARAQDKAYARAQAAKEQQKTKQKAAKANDKAKAKKADKSEL